MDADAGKRIPAPQRRRDDKLLWLGPVEKRKRTGSDQGGGTVHGSERQRPAALGDLGRSLATARAVAEGRPVLGGGSIHEPGKS